MRRSRVLTGQAARSALDHAEELRERAGVPLTARAPWMRTYLDVFAREQPVVVEVLEENGGIAAAACLARRDGPVVEWTSLAIGVSDYAAFVAVDDDAARLLAAAIAGLVGAGRRPWRLRLEQFPAGDPVLAHLRPLLPATFSRPGIPALRLALTQPRTLAGHLSRNGRRTVNKGWNRLRRDGVEVDARGLRDPAEVAAVLDEVVVLRRDRDHQVGRRSDLDDPLFEAFYRRLLPMLAGRGELELTVLRAGPQLIGYVLGFLDGSSYRMWDGRVATEWTRYSTGRLGDAMALTSALEDPRMATFDWMRGEQDYKKQAMSHVAEHEHLHAWSSVAVRRGYRGVLALRRRALRLTAPGAWRRWAATVLPRPRPRAAEAGAQLRDGGATTAASVPMRQES